VKKTSKKTGRPAVSATQSRVNDSIFCLSMAFAFSLIIGVIALIKCDNLSSDVSELSDRLDKKVNVRSLYATNERANHVSDTLAAELCKLKYPKSPGLGYVLYRSKNVHCIVVPRAKN
jgi:outer membrane murein-binding lipoprotein Lpp